MTAAVVNRTTGEITETCTADEAREITDRIKGAAESIWTLLLEAHERRAWSALGYARWQDYVQAEFDMSRRRVLVSEEALAEFITSRTAEPRKSRKGAAA